MSSLLPITGLSEESRRDIREALALLEAASDERMASLASGCKTTVEKLRKHLRAQCVFSPEFVAELLGGKERE